MQSAKKIRFSPKFKSVFTLVLLFVALVFVIYSLANSYREIGATVTTVNLVALAIGVLPCMAMIFLKSHLNYSIIANDHSTGMPEYTFMLRQFSHAQLVSNNLIIITCMLVYWSAGAYGAIYSIILFLALSLVLFQLFQTNAISKLYNLIVKYLFGIESSVSSFGFSKSIISVITLHLDWIAFFLLWYLLLPPQQPIEMAITLAVCYNIASIVGKLAFIMPSGMVVREAAFIWLGQFAGLELELLLIYSVVARLVFVVADIIFALVMLLPIANLRREKMVTNS